MHSCPGTFCFKAKAKKIIQGKGLRLPLKIRQVWRESAVTVFAFISEHKLHERRNRIEFGMKECRGRKGLHARKNLIAVWSNVARTAGHFHFVSVVNRKDFTLQKVSQMDFCNFNNYSKWQTGSLTSRTHTHSNGTSCAAPKDFLHI